MAARCISGSYVGVRLRRSTLHRPLLKGEFALLEEMDCSTQEMVWSTQEMVWSTSSRLVIESEAKSRRPTSLRW